VLKVTLHIHVHVLVAEHGLTGWMHVTAEDIELDDIQIIEFLQAQAGEISRFCASAGCGPGHRFVLRQDPRRSQYKTNWKEKET
jgi:hypothetical protein